MASILTGFRNLEFFQASSMDSLLEVVISSKVQQKGNVVERACLPPRRSVPSLVESSQRILYKQHLHCFQKLRVLKARLLLDLIPPATTS
jgi:hypothetical protein